MRARSLLACALVTVLSALAGGEAQAGAWPQDEGRWLVINSFTYSETNTTGYNLQGQKAGSGAYKTFEFSPYIEYGVSEDWTLGAQPRLDLVNLSYNNGRPSQSGSGLAAVNLFARYTVYRWDFDVLSVQGMLSVPGVAGNNQPVVASQWAAFEPRVMWGHSFDITDDISAFLDTELAYRIDAGHNADQVHLDVTIGVTPDPDWLFMIASSNTLSMRNNIDNGGDFDQYRILVSGAYQVMDDVWFQLGVFQDIATRKVSRSRGLTAALWFRF